MFQKDNSICRDLQHYSDDAKGGPRPPLGFGRTSVGRVEDSADRMDKLYLGPCQFPLTMADNIEWAGSVLLWR